MHDDDPMTLAFCEWAEDAEGSKPTLRAAFEAGWAAALDARDKEDDGDDDDEEDDEGDDDDEEDDDA